MCAVFLCCDMMTSEWLIIDTLVICINAAVFFQCIGLLTYVDVNIYSRTKCAKPIRPQYGLTQFVPHSTNYRLIMLCLVYIIYRTDSIHYFAHHTITLM